MKLRYLLLSLILYISSFAAEYHVNREADNQVRFISKTSVLDFDGVTDQIDGYVSWEKANIMNNNKFYLEVPLATLDTGIGLRNRHMRRHSLETDKYPFAKYEGNISAADTVNADTLNLVLNGTFSIHGFQNKHKVNVNAIAVNDGYVTRAEFQIKLTDYNIKIPDIMIMKVEEIIDVEVRIYFQKVK